MITWGIQWWKYLPCFGLCKCVGAKLKSVWITRADHLPRSSRLCEPITEISGTFKFSKLYCPRILKIDSHKPNGSHHVVKIIQLQHCYETFLASCQEIKVNKQSHCQLRWFVWELAKIADPNGFAYHPEIKRQSISSCIGHFICATEWVWRELLNDCKVAPAATKIRREFARVVLVRKLTGNVYPVASSLLLLVASRTPPSERR